MVDGALATMPDGWSVDYSYNVGTGEVGGSVNISMANEGISAFVGVGWGAGAGHSLTVNYTESSMLTSDAGAGIQASANTAVTGPAGLGAAINLYAGSNGVAGGGGAGVGLGRGITVTGGVMGSIYKPCSRGQ